ncbi:MAG: hypothetical protein LBC87_04745 [Fibromonadaceae bacterium]|jgi:hypothetical protein|nr:hypothetical protein [Fibromonadaceae bacterium]
MRDKLTKIVKVAIFGFALVGLFTSCAQVNSSVRLRPDLSDDDIEIWQIDARGNAYTSYAEIEKAMRKTAAEKSETEGYDCFFLYSDSYKTEHYSYTETTTKTMHGRANSYGSADYQSNYYNNNGYLGSSRGNINTRSNSNYSYQVPVTETYNYSKPTAVWYVFFKKEDECEKLGNSKWRENLYYNKDYLGEQSFH